MSEINRRRFLAASAVAPAVLAGTASAAPAPTAAATPASTAAAAGGMTLKAALQGRRSSRRFAPTPVPDDVLLRVLWAANGVNRPDGGQTSPSWRSAHDTVVYVATAKGAFKHAHKTNTLEKVSDADLRVTASDSAFVNRAPAVLIYASDAAALKKVADKADAQAQAVAAHVNAAMAAQNVYLACVAEGLGTCLIGGAANRAGIAKALKLPQAWTVTYVQPVGTPR